MVRMLFVRHGQSEANEKMLFTGQTDVSLSQTGRHQAQALKEFVLRTYAVDAIRSSDLKRACETVAPIAEALSLPVVRDARLREIFGGAWEGKSVFEIARLYPADYALWQRDIGHARCTQGESLQELQRRAVPAVRAIAAEYEGRCGTVLVATHAAFLRTMQCYWQHIPPDGMKDVPWVPNASVTEVHYFPDGASRLARLAQDYFRPGDITRISKVF